MMADAGRDIERRVLAHAVLAHLEHRILVHGPRTIVFHPDGWGVGVERGAPLT